MKYGESGLLRCGRWMGVMCAVGVQISKLAGALSSEVFDNGRVIIKQGEVGTSTIYTIYGYMDRYMDISLYIPSTFRLYENMYSYSSLDMGGRGSDISGWSHCMLPV